MRGALATDWRAKRTGVGQDTRGSMREMGEKKTGGDRVSVKERLMDRSVREAEGYRQGKELCFRSSVPEIYFHLADTSKKRDRGRLETLTYTVYSISTYTYIAGMAGRLEKGQRVKKSTVNMIF